MKLFDYDSSLMRFFTFLCNLTLLNIIWFLGCLPVVTAGASTVGLYYSADQLRMGDSAVWKNYKIGWKRHWKKATPVWLLFAVILFAFFYDYFSLSSPYLRFLKSARGGLAGSTSVTGINNFRIYYYCMSVCSTAEPCGHCGTLSAKDLPPASLTDAMNCIRHEPHVQDEAS